MRHNNFDLVRLLLAAVVVLVHSADLSGSASLAFFREVLSARLPVECFFVISGFLIFASYHRCATLREYFTNRAARILPGYWLATLFCVAIAVAHGSLHLGGFLLANLSFLTFLHPGIPGVFESNPGNSAMNGALWTIKIEVMFYLAVPVIAWICRRTRRDAALWTLLVASIAYRMVLARHETLAVQLPGELSFFLVGALVYYHFELFKRYGLWLTIGAAVLYAQHLWTGFYPMRPLAVGILVLAACLVLPEVKGPTRWGDFSYGTYVLHWPVIQLLVEAGWFKSHPWSALAATILLVGLGATLSWNLIEKPSLTHAKSRRLRQAALGNTANYPAAVP